VLREVPGALLLRRCRVPHRIAPAAIVLPVDGEEVPEMDLGVATAVEAGTADSEVPAAAEAGAEAEDGVVAVASLAGEVEDLAEVVLEEDDNLKPARFF
jgi:hypothetical protein